MALLPGRESIVQEALELAALAQMAFVSPDNLDTYPHLQHAISNHTERLLVEKLLSIAIKARFLDDQTAILKNNDRRLATIGKYYEDEMLNYEPVCIRHALNKLVHHKTIAIDAEKRTCIVLDGKPSRYDRLIKRTGPHFWYAAVIVVTGHYLNKSWRFEIDLFQLLNEVVRVFE